MFWSISNCFAFSWIMKIWCMHVCVVYVVVYVLFIAYWVYKYVLCCCWFFLFIFFFADFPGQFLISDSTICLLVNTGGKPAVPSHTRSQHACWHTRDNIILQQSSPPSSSSSLFLSPFFSFLNSSDLPSAVYSFHETAEDSS